ncbi:MAG: acetolactate synthase large subunit, partial [Streptosporangiaceae bacterium]|nr:acetolactate synthase large subunit [Streptosporangiaceae bacterium]
VLLHLGPGLGNGLANLHNARRAHTPVVVIVGAHATYHERYDAPLQSDIEGVARNVSGWYRASAWPREVGRDAAAAVAASRQPPGQVVTLVLPADASWSEGAVPARPRVLPPAQPVDDEAVGHAATVLASGEPVLLLLGGAATGEPGLRAASRICAATGARMLGEVFPARQPRGAGVPPLGRLAYLAGAARKQLQGIAHIVLAGARAPVSFFAYPGQPSDLVPDGASVHTLADGTEDVTAALAALADRVAPGTAPQVADLGPPAAPAGALDVSTLAAAVGATLPEGAIVVDEAQTSSLGLPGATARAARHDWITETGGAIGQGLPAALGAAIAAPDRPVLCIQADGSALYTHQALWTMAREQANVTTILVNNGAYAILRLELQRVGAGPAGEAGAAARRMLDLSDPSIDHAAIAQGFGVDAVRVATAEELVAALRRGYAEPGPHLIEAAVPPLL